MTPAIIGATGGTQTDRNRTYQADGSITDTYTMAASEVAAFIATYTIGTSAIGTLKLAEINENTSKGFSRVTLKFVTPSAYSTEFGGTDNVKSADCASSENPIALHPKSYSPYPDEDGVWSLLISGSESKKPGVESYLIPSPTYEYSTVQSSFTFSEANIISGVGELSDPTGMTSPTTGAWLKVSRRISPEGESFRVTDIWQYGGWDDEIYDTTP